VAKKKIRSCSVAQAYLELLSDRGIDFLFANAGTDFAPIIEAYCKGEQTGSRMPTPVLAPHENIAIAMAIGYYLVTGRMQAVMVHVNVGTANAICGLMNAWRGNIPVLLTAGRTPYTESGLIGSRTGEIHWPQEMRDQRAIVREMVKWDYELPNAEVLEAMVDRAINICLTEPRGPAYITLPRETLATELDMFEYDSPSVRQVPSVSFPDPSVLELAADLIAKAKRPLIITSAIGRTEDEMLALADFAEFAAIPVVQRKPRYVALPSNHSMHFGYRPEDYFDECDLILVMECNVPWLPLRESPGEAVPVLHFGADPIFSDYPMRGFKTDLALTGEIKGTLKALRQVVSNKLNAEIVAERRGYAQDVQSQRAKRRATMLEHAKSTRPIHPVWISHCINQIADENTIIVRESPIVLDQLEMEMSGSVVAAGAAGALGWGLGTALGVKKAAPEKLVICTVGDGAYMFGNPVPAHYVASAEGLPILTIIFNNEMWGAVKRTTREVYPDGFASRTAKPPLTVFETGTFYEKTVEIVGGYGERVEDPAQLLGALQRAVAEVKNGRQALLNVICSGP